MRKRNMVHGGDPANHNPMIEHGPLAFPPKTARAVMVDGTG